MPSENTEARTGDSLGWWGVDSSIRSKMGKGDALPKKIADHLQIPTSDKEREDIAHDVTKVIENFSISDSDAIGQEHFDAADVDFDSKKLAYAQMYWADLNDANGQIRVTNSHLTKMWALTNPDLGEMYGGNRNSFGKADVIFFDEAQDINPVMAKVIRDQNIQKIYVGDSNQAIYGFRGADDELDKVETDITLPMTRTFRFGQTLAGPGNRMLSLLGSKYKIIGAGKTDGTVVPTGTMTDADAVLTRTNGGRFSEIISELANGRVVGLTREDKGDAERMLATVRWLKTGGTKPFPPHEDFDGYTTWKQVSYDVQRDKASGKVTTIFNIFDGVTSDLTVADVSQALGKVKVIADDDSQNPIDYSDGASGVFGPSVTYSVKDAGSGNLTMTINGQYRPMQKYISLLRPSAFRYDSNTKSYSMTGTPEELKNTVDGIRGVPVSDVDVVVSTAHKAKGLEWKKVRIGDDFWGPEADEEGNLIFPEKQELNLAYVALTRAEESIDPGSLSWVYEYTSDDDEDPNTPSRGLPEGTQQAGVTPEPAEEVVEEQQEAEEVVEEVSEPVGTTENPVTPAPAESGEVVEEVDLDALDEETAEEVVAGPAPAEKKTDAPLTTNEDQSNLDPAPAETTDTGVEGVSNDPQDIADTYDNKNLKDALVTAVQNDEPGINIEGENGNTAVVPVENVRDALQKQGTNTNDLIDEALGAPPAQDVPAEILSDENSKASEDQMKRFLLNHLMQTREAPEEHKDAIYQVATDNDATDEQLDWAIGVLNEQPNLLDVKNSVLPTLPDNIISAKITDPGEVIKAIELAYPNATSLQATGDLIVHSVDYQDKKSKTNFRYELSVVRTSNEMFYVYARETNLSTGETRSRRVSPFTHSAKALNNDIIDARLEMLKTKSKRAKNLNLWFGKPNSKSDSIYIQEEGKISLEDGSSEPIHRREEPIHRDLVEAIKDALNKEDVTPQIVQAIYREIARHGIGEAALREIQTNFNVDDETFSRVIDTLNAHVSVQYKIRTYNIWVSDDKETPVDSGDLVDHTHETTKDVRRGRVIVRQGIHWTKGYGYTDYVWFRPIIGYRANGSEILGKGSSVTSKNLNLILTAQGTDGSERRGALADFVNVPVSVPVTTRPERKAPMEPAKPAETVAIDRTEPTKPAVTVAGEKKPAAANRNTNINQFTPTDIDAAQLQVGDYFMTMDPEAGIPRLAEVVSVEFNDEAGTFKVTAIIPETGDTAQAFEQEWDVNPEDGLSSQRMIAFRKPAAEPDKASDESIQNLLLTIRSHDTSFLSEEDDAEIKDFVSRFVSGDDFTQDEVDALINKITESPNRISEPTSSETATEVAQTVIDGSADTTDTTALQDVVNEATLKVSELDDAGETDEPNVLTGFTIKQNANGVYYPEGGIRRGSKLYKAIRRGEVIPPNFPFITSDTDWGGVMYFDSNGDRHWGQFGAAGAVLRVKDANGEYKYLLARRAKGMSTGGGKWSVPGGAHDDITDKNTPVVTSARELYEELGIDPTGMIVAGGAKKTVAPDWEYDYSIIDTADETITDGIDLKKNPEISELGWFTADEIRDLQANDEMHGDVDSQILDDIFAVGDAPTTDPLVIDETIFTPDVEPNGFVDLTGFTMTGGQGGSNPGGTFQGPNGEKYYAKFQRSDMHAANEVATAKLYDAAGVGVVDINHGALEGKSNVTQSPVIYVDRNKSPQSDSALRKKTQEGFAIDAWLANWDGVLNDNTLADANGDPVRMDVGGSMLFRAQGGAKGTQFGDTVTEIDSLRDPSVNAAAAAVYGSMTDSDIKESAKKLLNISENDIDNIVDEAFSLVDNSNQVDVDNLKATLKARRRDILDRFGPTEADTTEPNEPTSDEADSDVTPEVTDVVSDSDATETTTTTREPVEGAPEASYDPSASATMDRDFNAIMTNFGVIKNSVDGDNIRVEYGYVDEDGNNQMRIIGVRKSSGVWKSSKESDAKEVIFDTDNGVYTLTDDELIAKLDELGSDKTESSKVLRFGSRASSENTELTPQMIKYGYVDNGTSTDARTTDKISQTMYGESEDVVLTMTYRPDGISFVGYKANGDEVEYSVAQIQERSENGEVFKIGTPRGAATLGSKATTEWIASPLAGDQMFINGDYYNNTGAILLAESFTANEDGEWVSSYTGKTVDKTLLAARSDLKVGSPKRAIAAASSTSPDELFAYELSNRGTVKSASDASKAVVDNLPLGAIITDGTNKYRYMRPTTRTYGFENVETGEVITKLEMRKIWDLNQDGFKFHTGLDGLNAGDTISDPIAAKQSPIGSVFMRAKSFKLPYAKTEKTQKEYYVYSNGYWQSSSGSNASLGAETMAAYISRGEIVLETPDSLTRANAIATSTSEGDTSTTVDTSPATPEETAALASKLSTLDNNLTKIFTPNTETTMDGVQTRGLLDFIDKNVSEDGTINDVAVAEAYVRFYPTPSTLPSLMSSASKEEMLDIISQLDNEDYKTRGGRTFKTVLDDFDDAVERSTHRINNVEVAHPLGELGSNSNPIMELLNTLFPELSDRPQIMSTRKELEDYESPSELIYRGVNTVYKKDSRGNYFTDENGNAVVLGTPEELHKAYRDEDGVWWGYGVYGQGQYFAENRTTSESSYTDKRANGVAVGKISSEANIFSTANEYDDNIYWLQNYSSNMLYAYLISQGYTPGTVLFNQKMQDFDNKLFGDASGRAGFFGYDALYIQNNKYYVVLNRAATVMYDGVASDWDKESDN
jgi:8-oxo-dGTP pyrophosphatase MutT (NUDIX family)